MIDGDLDEPCWSKAGEIGDAAFASGRARQASDAAPTQTGYVRHDDKNLYVGYRKVQVPIEGEPHSSKAATKGKDAPVWEDDSLEIFLGDGTGGAVVHLGVSASGATYDGLAKGSSTRAAPRKYKANVEIENDDTGWNGEWTSGARLDEKSLGIEIALPWKTVEQVGIDKNDLRLGFSATSAKVLYLSTLKPTAKPYTVRLHFADPDNDHPGRRVFDVKLCGKTVLNDFDIVAESGGRNRAVIKEFKSVPAMQNLVLELVANTEKLTATSAPIICGIQIVAEEPGPLPEPILLRRNPGMRSTYTRYCEGDEYDSQKAKDKRRGVMPEGTGKR